MLCRNANGGWRTAWPVARRNYLHSVAAGAAAALQHAVESADYVDHNYEILYIFSFTLTHIRTLQH